MKSGAPPEVLAESVRERFFPIAFLLARKILVKRFCGEELYDRSAELAQRGIEDQLQKLAEGRFTFKGNSSYSTYLFKVLKRMAYKKITIPVPIQRNGLQAIEVYRLVYTGWRDSDIIQEMAYGRGFPEKIVAEAILSAKTYLAKKPPKDYESKTPVESYDRMIEDPEHFREPGTRSSALDDAIRTDTREALHEAIGGLNEVERKLIEEHFFEDRQLKDIGKQLGLAHPVYEKNKALKKLEGSLKGRLQE